MPLLYTGSFFNFGGGESAAAGSSATITIPSGKVSADLTDFPVYFDMSLLPSAFWSQTTDGTDLRCSQSSNNKPLDIVWIDTGTSTGLAYIKADITSASATTIDVLWGQSPLDQMNDTWSDYEWVMIPLVDAADRTGNNSYGTETTVSFAAATGTLPEVAGGGAMSLDGSSYYDVTVADISTMSGILTMGASFRHTGSAQDAIISYRDESSGSTNDRITMVVDNGNIAPSLWDDANSWVYGSSTIDPATTTWYRQHATYNAATERSVFLDGGVKNTDSGITNMSSRGQDMMTIGRGNTSNGEVFTGYVGWVYLRPGVVSDAWIAAEYDMMTDSAFLSVA